MSEHVVSDTDHHRDRLSWLGYTLLWTVLAAGVMAPCVDAQIRDPDQRVSGVVYRLIPSGSWHARWLGPDAGSAMNEAWPMPGSYTAVYVADVMPGQTYDLGLRLRAELNTRVHVAVYDRIPWSPKAKRQELPMGPVVRTQSPDVEYRWHIGISPRSAGRSMFISIELASGPGQSREIWYAVYMGQSSRRPMDARGRGITYLAGPDDLVLAASSEHPRVLVITPAPSIGGNATQVTGWAPNLIHNGGFRQGLDGWELLPGDDNAATGLVSVDNDGLIIRGGHGTAHVGVRQVLQRRVVPGQPLLLKMAISMEQDPLKAAASEEAPLEVSACYLDMKGKEHCGARAYRRQFATTAVGVAGADILRVPRSARYVFEDDLGRLRPRPTVITSITIRGSMNAGEMARVYGIWLRQP